MALCTLVPFLQSEAIAQPALTLLSHLLSLHSVSFQLQGLCALSGLVGRAVVGSLLPLVIVLCVSSVRVLKGSREPQGILGKLPDRSSFCLCTSWSFPWKREFSTHCFLVKKQLVRFSKYLLSISNEAGTVPSAGLQKQT